jgi:hypothetical protein
MIPVEPGEDQAPHQALANKNVESGLDFGYGDMIFNIGHVSVYNDDFVACAHGGEAALTYV